MPQSIKDIAIALEMKRFEDPLLFYRPNPKQRILHESLADIDLFCAGNGSGKTYGAGTEFIMAMRGDHYVDGKYPDRPLDGRIIAKKEALYGNSPESNTIIPLLKRYLKNHLVPGSPTKMGKHYESQWNLKNGSSFDILTNNQGDDAFESVSKDVIWFDEPFRESIWVASTTRMRTGKGGKIIISMTPLVHAGWTYDRFINNDDTIYKLNIIYATLWDNCRCLTPEKHDFNLKCGTKHDRDGYCICNGGYIHKVAIEKMIAQWDEQEIDARVFGHHVILRDRIFTHFDPNVHVLAKDLTPDDAQRMKLDLFVAVDPHQRRPPAWGLYGISSNGVVYILDEFPNINHGMYSSHNMLKPVFFDQMKDVKHKLDEVIAEFDIIERYWGQPIIDRFMDPRFAHQKVLDINEYVIDAYRKSSEKIGSPMRFKQAKVGRDAGEGEISYGISLIRDALKYDDTLEIDEENTPKLFVNPRCANHIRMFNYVKYSTKGGTWKETHAPSEDIEKRFKDFLDLVRYAFRSFWRKYNTQKIVPREVLYQYVPSSYLTGY